MSDRIKCVLADNVLLVFFMAVYLSAWTANAFGNHFVMSDLQILAWLVGGIHANNSLLNSTIPMISQFKGGAPCEPCNPSGHSDGG